MFAPSRRHCLRAADGHRRSQPIFRLAKKTKAIFGLGPLSKLVRLTGGTPPNLEMKTLSKALRHPHQIFFIFFGCGGLRQSFACRAPHDRPPAASPLVTPFLGGCLIAVAKKITRMAESLWGAGMCGFFDHVFPAAGPIPSLGELQRTTPWVWLHCERCQYHAPLACAVAVIRWGADASSDRLDNAPGAARAAIRARRSSIPVGR